MQGYARPQGLTGSLAVAPGNGAVFTVTGTVGVEGISFPSTVSVSNFPAVQAISGSVAVSAPSSAPVWVTGSVGLATAISVSAGVATTGSLGLAVGNAGSAPLFITGTVTINNPGAGGGGGGSVTQGTVPWVVQESSPISVWNAGPVGVTGSLTFSPTYNNTPQGVSGSPGGYPILTYDAGTQGISGAVSITSLPQVQVSNFPATQNVSGTVTANVTFPANQQVWSAEPVGVSGSVSVSNFPGQVSVNNFPATQNVSGTVTANVTFPVNQQVWTAEPQGISGSVNILSLPQVSVDNFPAVQAVSGTLQAAAFIQNWPAVVGVSGSLSVTPAYNNTPQGVSGTVQVYTSGLQGISGTVTIGNSQLSVSNFPATQAVSGSVTVGGYSPGVTGSTYITATGSLPVAVVGTVPVSIGGTVNVSQQGQVSVNNFPATQNVSGTVTANVAFPNNQQVWTEGTQGISGSVTVGGYSTNVTASVYAPPGAPVWITGSVYVDNPSAGGGGGNVTIVGSSTTLNVQEVAPVQVWSEGNVGVSGTVAAAAYVQNWPAVMGVSGSLSVAPVYTNTPQGVSGNISVSVTGSTGLLIAAPQGSPAWVTGSVALNPVPTINVAASKSTTHSTTHVTASLTSQVVLFPNSGRLGASFINVASSQGNAYVSLGTTASTGSFLAWLPPGTYYSMDTVSTEAVSVIFDGVPGDLMITEQE